MLFFSSIHRVCYPFQTKEQKKKKIVFVPYQICSSLLQITRGHRFIYICFCVYIFIYTFVYKVLVCIEIYLYVQFGYMCIYKYKYAYSCAQFYVLWCKWRTGVIHQMYCNLIRMTTNGCCTSK